MRSSSILPRLATVAAAAAWACIAIPNVVAQTEQPDEPPEPVAVPTVPASPAEPPPPTPEELARQRPIVFEFKARGELGFNAGLRDEPGDVTVSRVGSGLGVALPVRQFAQVDLGLDYEFSHYAFSDATTFAPGFDAPWENIHRETFSARFSQQQTMRLGWFVGGTVGFAHEEGASISDALVGSAYAGVRLAMAENFFLGAGVVVWSQLDDDPLVFPLPSIDWWLSEQVRLTSAGQLGATLLYKANEQLTFSIGAEYELREFRLRESGPSPDGVGRDRRVPIAVGMAYTPTPKLSFEVQAGAYLWQQFRLLDDDRNTIAEIDARPTPFAGLQVGYRF